MKSSTSPNDVDFLPYPEVENDYDNLSFDSSNTNEDYDGSNDNIEDCNVTSEYYDEVDKDVDVSVKRYSDSIYDILAGRFLCAWVRSKSPA